MQFKFRSIIIFKDSSRAISPEPIWVCFQSSYMHTAPSLPKLLIEVVTHWNDERRLIG